MSATAEPAVFDAILRPHRSLPPAAFRWLMAAVIVAGSIVGGVFLARGAWPVTGFFGLEIAVLYLFFRANYRAARVWERLRLWPSRLRVERGDSGGPRHAVELQPHWLRVQMDDPPRHESQLRLTTHGQTVSVGSFLTPEERLDLARALERALGRVRAVPAVQPPDAAGR